MSRLESSRSRLAYPVALLFLFVVGGCDDGTPGEPQTTESAIFGTISITGHVLDANGLGRANVTVTLAGSSQGTRTTDSQGAYAFTSLAAGSYSVRPTFSGCTFNPDVVNLNNLSASTVRDFFGSGTSCGGTGNVNAGATSGPLTISGTVTDAAGNRVVGGKITLGGGATAIRFTDHTGKYAFHVAAGFYSLTASGACGLSPASTSFTINGNRTQDFTGGGAVCITAHPASTSPTGQFLSVYQGTAPIGTTIVRVEPRASAADALAALQAISQETSVPVRSLTIAGSPAVERQVVVPTPEIELPGVPELENSIGLTTAIALGATLVRFESRLPDDASSATINAFFLAGRNFQPENISALVIPARPIVPTSRAATPPGPAPEIQFAPHEIGLEGAEVQVAASETSKSFVVAGSVALSFSKDDGATVAFSTLNTMPPQGTTTFNSLSDPQVAVGPSNGATSPYYHTELALVTAGSKTTKPVVAIGLWKSVDDGQTFNPAPVAYPLNCSTSGGACVVPDQAQLAVDTHNRANNATDQIYLAWRNYPATGFSLALACSLDGGQTWRFDYSSLGTKGEDYPRLTVADDGSLFVAYMVPVPVAGGTTQTGLRVQKFSSCAQGFLPAAAGSAYPFTVANYAAPSVIAGLPRQPAANYSVAAAADSSKLVYIAYAAPSGSNDDVHVAQWSENSKTLLKDNIVNTVSAGRRFFPSVCSTGSTAFVAWYDRRAGDDKTSFFRRSIINDGAALGHEFNFTGTGREDPQCLAGFPGGGSTTPAAETLCTDLPTLNSLGTGTCQTAPPCAGGAVVCGTLTSCDFRPGAVGGACTMPETCNVPYNGGVSPGSPTFGDYNQTACARGKMFVAWGTTTSPRDSCTMTGDACTDNSQCCSTHCESGICHSFAGTTCAANGGACTQDTDCCNGGGSKPPGVCQGGICFRRVGLFTATGGKATIVHIKGSSTATLYSSAGATPFTKSFDHSISVGLDGRGGGFWDTLDTSPAGGSAGAGFKLQPNDDDILITSEAESFGPAQTSFAFNTIVIHPGETYVFTGGLSTAFPPSYAPYTGGDFTYSFNLTTSQEP